MGGDIYTNAEEYTWEKSYPECRQCQEEYFSVELLRPRFCPPIDCPDYAPWVSDFHSWIMRDEC